LSHTAIKARRTPPFSAVSSPSVSLPLRCTPGSGLKLSYSFFRTTRVFVLVAVASEKKPAGQPLTDSPRHWCACRQSGRDDYPASSQERHRRPIFPVCLTDLI